MEDVIGKVTGVEAVRTRAAGLRWYDYITVNIFFLGLTSLANTNTLIIPLLVQQFVGEESKGAHLGSLRMWTLMTAVLFQAVMGMLSDRSRLAWGRRRPFILVGTLLAVACIVAIGAVIGMEGMPGYWLLLGLAILMSAFSNTAQSAQQGLIPDVVPENKRGLFSGIKALFELPLPLILVAFTVAKVVKGGDLWGGLLIAMGILLASMLLAMLVSEKRLATAPPLDWAPINRLMIMTGSFALVILIASQGVVWAGRLLAGVSSPVILFGVMGLVGLAAMALAIGLGVWLCVRVALGDEARRYPSFTWWVINRLAFLVGAVNIAVFATYFIQGRLGFRFEEATGPALKLLMMVGGFILISALPSGWLADKLGRKKLVGLSGLLAGIGALIALTLPSLVVVYVGGAFIGIACGLFYAASWAMGTSLVPPGEAARYLGISNLAGAGAGAVGAYIGGPIADLITSRLPVYAGGGYVLLFSIYALFFLLSILPLQMIRAPVE